MPPPAVRLPHGEQNGDGAADKEASARKYGIHRRLARTTQQELFDATTLPLLQDAVRGGDAMVFAYGITNAGKTTDRGRRGIPASCRAPSTSFNGSPGGTRGAGAAASAVSRPAAHVRRGGRARHRDGICGATCGCARSSPATAPRVSEGPLSRASIAAWTQAHYDGYFAD